MPGYTQYCRKRRGKRCRTTGLNKELYPSFSATSRKYPRLGECGTQRIPVEDQEPRAIKCAQCGQPIEDYTALPKNLCPFCQGDNTRGYKFRKC